MGLRDSEEKLMQNFFVESSQIRDNKIFMEGKDVNHIKNVLRMRPGEDIRVTDGKGGLYLCCIEKYENGGAFLDIIKVISADTELPSRITLFQGLPKGDKMEWIVQKAVELGASSIIPFEAKRSVAKLDEKKAEKKKTRWQAIARGAAEQSGRGIIPEVGRVMSFSDALKAAETLDVVLIPYELEEGMAETARVINAIRPGQSIGVFIGPEGGFEAEEIARARDAGAVPITLGKRILRTETAGLTALSVLMYHLESRAHSLIERKE